VLRRFSIPLATVVAGVGMMTTVALGGPAHAAITPVGPASLGVAAVEQESFESGMGAWAADTDGRARAWQISRSTAQAYDGKYSLAFYLDGRNDDGTIWIERKFTARPNTTVTVSTTFRIYSSASSDLNTWAVVGYAGTHDPETTADIRTVIGLVNQRGWTPYSYIRKVTTDSTGTVWVAVGIWATYEVIRTNYVDLVQTSIA
jgi:hypothetical protein